jgi:hypothetical protein
MNAAPEPLANDVVALRAMLAPAWAERDAEQEKADPALKRACAETRRAARVAAAQCRGSARIAHRGST